MSNKTKKYILLIILSVILVNAFIYGTVAYFTRVDVEKSNFMLGTVEPEIVETFDANNNIYENIYIKNVGNNPIYVRVADIYYFVNDNGQILGDIPVIDVDYSINFSSSDDWVKSSDGYYYYTKILNPEETTSNLIEQCVELKKSDDKTFMLDIVVQSIQAFPERAIEEAWGVSVNNNNLEILK